MGNHLLAKSMLVFMIRRIFKPSLSFPIASYPASNLSGEKLYPVVMEVVEALELSNIAVIYIAVTSDRASPNHTFYKLWRLLTGLKVPYKTRTPYADRDIYIFCDPPHLMKTAGTFGMHLVNLTMHIDIYESVPYTSGMTGTAAVKLEAPQLPRLQICDETWLVSNYGLCFVNNNPLTINNCV